MSERKEFQLFDNYEEDGQLSLFSPAYDDWDEDWVEENGKVGQASGINDVMEALVSQDNTPNTKTPTKPPVVMSEGSRVKYCSCCGKLLFVREEAEGFYSECNNCSIKYFHRR